MKSENKRIFISDLPGPVNREELESSFSSYGQVSSVEIKQRKELGPTNKSLFFAYVNLITDDKSLNKCFQDLSGTKWHGQYVQLQLARESFLERLKRERQETQGKETNHIAEVNKSEFIPSIFSRKSLEKDVSSKPKVSQVQICKQNKSSSESDTSESLSDTDLKHIQAISKPKNNLKLETTDEGEKLDIIFKCNKNKVSDRGVLKIPSVGKSPIVEITTAKTKVKQNNSEANMKRLQSLRDMKKGYATQKSLIKNALSYGTSKPNNKIIFDEDSNNPIKEPNQKVKINGLKKPSLFDEANSGDDSDFETNFDIKEQFQGQSGQKLLELQSRYKNDKRFALDERFMEAEEDDDHKQMLDAEDNIEAEKNEQLKILEEVLGKKLTSKSTTKKDSASRKTMLKFDPSQPEHSNLELAISEPEKKRKKKDKIKEQEAHDFQKTEPEVSKEIFYKIPEKLKDTFAEKPQFSLLSMFGRRDETEDTIQDETEKEIKQNLLFDKQQNPFKYDSSDDEDEIEDIPHKNTMNNASQIINSGQTPAKARQSVFWTEPFFFKSDDFRLQEGQDFIQKIKGENKEFLKIRKELKGIVKAKVRNNERKNKMFKKKLGGSKRRKHVRIKKALKR